MEKELDFGPSHLPCEDRISLFNSKAVLADCANSLAYSQLKASDRVMSLEGEKTPDRDH